ncbi:hypothetical protein B9Z55_025074 [Caenorhabditis nigoni]|uniref:Uncharacterized protein n=1 Tax=Caenorhabditis nigoni TaxID=1611254 RepID=A0A2G5SWS4_9PELO|nr:hypothetical protein B9Z55_025074 [Caenorhabditis nigoni]
MSSAIPDADKKLSYDCLKCVLQQFEANFRFRLAERLPKIRCADKAVPLKISKLTFCEEGFKLNDTDYRLGIICQVRNGHAPEGIIDRSRYGDPRDVDQFGFEKRSFSELTPGDILVQDFDPQIVVDDYIEFERTEESFMIEQDRLIAQEKEKLELEHASERVENVPKRMKFDPEEDVPMEKEPENKNDSMDPDQLDIRKELIKTINIIIRESKKSLARIQFDLERYRCKRNNLPPPFALFVQFTNVSSDGTVHIERFNYDKSLMKAWKYLTCKFLGNRKSVIKIGSLGFWAQKQDGLIVCLPEDVKLDVRKFGTSGNLSEVLQRVEPLLEYPKRPFSCLKSDCLRLEDAQNPIVQNAEVLQFYDNWNVDYIALCREVPNRKIMISLGQKMTPRQYRVLVQNLIDTKGTLGTCYEITQLDEKRTKKTMRAIAKRYDNAVVGERQAALKSQLVALRVPDSACSRFTKTSSDGTVHIERFDYDKSLMKAWKHLISKILGNRKSVVKIGSLGFWAQKRDGLVVCLPEDIKLDVRNFATSGNLSDVLQRVKPLLEYPNRPFGRLTSDGMRLEDAHNPKVQNAEVLTLYDNWDADYIALCREVQNKKIVISSGAKIPPRQYGVLVQNLIDTKGTLGTYYKITQPGEKRTRKAMRVIAKRYDNAVVGERFRLAERLPKVHSADKAVPLNISKLTFCEEGFKLNDTDYRLGIICQIRYGHAPETIIVGNQYGHPRDVDRFGFEKRFFPELTPGDIFVQDFNPQMDVDDDLELAIISIEASFMMEQDRLIALEKEKIKLENALKRVENFPKRIKLDPEVDVLMKIEPRKENDSVDSDQFDRITDQDLCHEELERINISIQDAKKSLARIEFDLARYRCKRDNLPLPYDFFVQFTNVSSDGTVHIERFYYDKSLMEAWKYLTCKFLVNRKSVIKIGSLGFWAQKHDGLIVCLPEDVKLDVRKFGTSGNLSEVLQRVEPLLEYPKRPFSCLKSDCLRLEDAHNSKVQNAEVLHFYDNWNVDYIALCREVPNRKIMISLGQKMTPRQYRVLVQNLIDTKGTLGTYYEITQPGEKRTRIAMKIIAKRYNNAVVGER